MIKIKNQKVKKILSYILIPVILLQILAPFSIEEEKPLRVTPKKAMAAQNIWIEKAKVFGEGKKTNISYEVRGDPHEEDFIKTLWGYGPSINSVESYSMEITIFSSENMDDNDVVHKEREGYKAGKWEYQVSFNRKLEENKTYYLKLELIGESKIKYDPITPGDPPTYSTPVRKPLVKVVEEFKTGKDGEKLEQEIDASELRHSVDGTYNDTRKDDVFNCHIIDNFRGCVAEVAYLVLFKPSSFIFALAGKALDYTLQHSLKDTSYRSAFVVEGWGIVRDICNLFFIFVLLYIAFKVILNVGKGGDPKGLIINVIIVGLLINFSLFATRVIIDASNILSRVFYNEQVIASGKTGSGGEIEFSAAIVATVNPIALFQDAHKVEEISNKTEEAARMRNDGRQKRFISGALQVTLGTFILICLLSAAICIVGFVVFLNLTLVFVARVVMLWIAMIISPIALFTYAIPELKNKEFVGFDKWISNTVSMAFVAPVFCFFMYIILTFLESGLGLVNAMDKGGLDFVVGIFLPFIALMYLLMQVKKIAVSMSGEAGKFASDLGNKVAGKGLGLATGGAAWAMRGTVGAIGARVASSETLSKWEDKGGFAGMVGKTVRRAGAGVGSKSFDMRNTALGKAATEGMGVKTGEGKKGGVLAQREAAVEREKKRQERMDKLRPKTEEQKRKEEAERQKIALERKNKSDLEDAEKERDDIEKKIKGIDEQIKSSSDPEEIKKLRAEREEERIKLVEARKRVSSIKKGGSTTVPKKDKDGKIMKDSQDNIIYEDNLDQYNTTNGNISQNIITQVEKDLQSAEQGAREAENKLNQAFSGGQGERNQVAQEHASKETAINDKYRGKRNAALRKRNNATANVENFILDEIRKINNSTTMTGAQKSLEIQRINQDGEKEKLRISMEAEVAYREEIESLNNSEQLELVQNNNEKDAAMKAIKDNITGLTEALREARSTADEANQNMDRALRAKDHAMEHGGLGASQEELDVRIRAEERVLRETNQDQAGRRITTANQLMSGNFFDWLSSRGISLSESQRQQMANDLYGSGTKKE